MYQFDQEAAVQINENARDQRLMDIVNFLDAASVTEIFALLYKSEVAIPLIQWEGDAQI